MKLVHTVYEIPSVGSNQLIASMHREENSSARQRLTRYAILIIHHEDLELNKRNVYPT